MPQVAILLCLLHLFVRLLLTVEAKEKVERAQVCPNHLALEVVAEPRLDARGVEKIVPDWADI